MKKPKYCNFCGLELTELEPECSFDIHTGKQRTELRCPKYEGRHLHFSMPWPRIKGWDY